jgi:hypothetical protein
LLPFSLRSPQCSEQGLTHSKPSTLLLNASIKLARILSVVYIWICLKCFLFLFFGGNKCVYPGS